MVASLVFGFISDEMLLSILGSKLGCLKMGFVVIFGNWSLVPKVNTIWIDSFLPYPNLHFLDCNEDEHTEDPFLVDPLVKVLVAEVDRGDVHSPTWKILELEQFDLSPVGCPSLSLSSTR